MDLSCDTQRLLSSLLVACYLTPMAIVYIFVVVLILSGEKTPFYVFVLGVAFADASALINEYLMFAARLTPFNKAVKVVMVFMTSFGLSVGQKIQFVVALARIAAIAWPVNSQV